MDVCISVEVILKIHSSADSPNWFTVIRNVPEMQKRLMIRMQNEQNGRKDLVHTLSVAHHGILARITKQNVDHDVLNERFPIEFDARKGTNYILFNYGTKFLITKMLVPNALLGLRQRIILDVASRRLVRIQAVSFFQFFVPSDRNVETTSGIA